MFPCSTIDVSAEVKEHIMTSGEDYRLSTTCCGPVLHPVRLKSQKKTDIVINIGKRCIYVSEVQARFISRIDGNIIMVDGRR